jgi:hypothetical protein
MPEIKNQFTGGKMEKDLDERLVPNGQYRDAMNIQVATSESSAVGTIQNILGNSSVAANFNFTTSATVVGTIADEKVDTLYWFVWDVNVDCILSYKRNDPTVKLVFVDREKLNGRPVLKFHPTRLITGINIIDDMLFWTDNYSEPKKINIKRSLFGTTDFLTHTKLVVDQVPPLGQYLMLPDPVEEKHITVIKRTPYAPPTMRLGAIRDPSRIYTAIVTVQNDLGQVNTTSFSGQGIPNSQDSTYNFATIDPEDDNKNTLFLRIEHYIDSLGNEMPINFPQDMNGWYVPGSGALSMAGTKVVFKAYSNPLDWNDVPALPVTDWTLKGVILELLYCCLPGPLVVRVKFTSIEGTPPLPDLAAIPPQVDLKYVMDLFEEKDKLFEFKFPRFSYRYKYEDGEYSPFAPFTQVAFSPGSFDYHPRKGYNLGMTNNISKIFLSDFINEEMDKDIVSCDILFKDDASSVIYVVDTITPLDYSATINAWDSIKGGGDYEIMAETVNNIVASNQLLRPWDNVPRKALAQDVTGNRIVYGNYIQNYNLLTGNDKHFSPSFDTEWSDFPNSQTESSKSIKSLREYQLGVVFTDKFGRETPVISNATGTIKLLKDRADDRNRVRVQLTGGADTAPIDAEHMKFFIKETSNEYYNLAMDRWYNAEDGNIWLSFPSSDRNKVDIDTFLILKKGTDSDALVEEAARYKILAIEAEAPEFIKTQEHIGSSERHIAASGSTAGSPLWDPGIIDGIPLIGSKEIFLDYNRYKNTPARNLHGYKDGDLYIEFSMQGQDETSARYKIAFIACDHDLGGATAVQTGDKYRIQLEEPMGDDVNFLCIGGGVNPTGVVDGTIVNIYKYEKVNAPQFDGKFFVKIYFDDVFKKNIKTTFIGGAKYRSVQSKMVYRLKQRYIEQFTADMSWWFTPGKWQGDYPGYSGYVTAVEGAGVGAGWHNQFTYGTRYAPSATNTGNEKGTIPGYGWGMNPARSFGIYWGARKWSGGELGNAAHTRAQGHYFTKTNPHSSNYGTPYRDNYGLFENDKYAAANLYFRRFKLNNDTGVAAQGLYAPAIHNGGDKRDYANWDSWGNENNVFNGWHPKGNSTSVKTLIQDDHTSGNENNKKSYKDAECWFIDEGVYQARRFNNEISFTQSQDPWSDRNDSALNYSETNPNPTNTTGRYSGGGLINGATTWGMQLGFGGVLGGSDHAGKLWEIGEWNIDQTVATNPYYSDSLMVNWVNRLNPGNSFRWLNDPTKTIYNMPSSISPVQIANHSLRPYGDDDYELANISATAAIGMHPKSAHNIRKGWGIRGITPELAWNPMEEGEITNGISILLQACNINGDTDPTAALGACIGSYGQADGEDVVIYVTDIQPDNSNIDHFRYPGLGLHEGMALKRYTSANDVGVSEISSIDDPEDRGTSIIDLTGGYSEPLNAFTTTNYFAGFKYGRGNDFLVVRKITKIDGGPYELTLGGYNFPMQNADHEICYNDSTGTHPQVGGYLHFVQVGMNGHNANTEFNINNIGYVLNGQYEDSNDHTVVSGCPTSCSQTQQPFHSYIKTKTSMDSTNTYFQASTNGYHFCRAGIGPDQQPMGKIGAVGYALEFVEPILPLETMSENPAIWETEPKESKDLDIYYETTGAIPLQYTEKNIHEALPIGTIIAKGTVAIDTDLFQNDIDDTWKVIGYSGDKVEVEVIAALTPTPSIPPNGPYPVYYATTPTNLRFSVQVLEYSTAGQILMKFKSFLYDSNFWLPWHNCYSFGNGVESNRIRDNFNLPYISNGAKASTTLEDAYRQEHRKYGMIYSGIYNSMSGVNNLNQFIQAEKITKDINPIYGSIQKLYARDEDLIALCEDKILKILSSKDAVFNADGNTNLTATNRVLGQAIPYSGEYGISTNPESFASENYRVYFADRIRGAILRLSMDGLTPISDYGMKDWFRDNLKLVGETGRIIGGYDDRNDEYVVKLGSYDGPPFEEAGGGIGGIVGCMNYSAINYNPNATIPGYCTYGDPGPSEDDNNNPAG